MVYQFIDGNEAEEEAQDQPNFKHTMEIAQALLAQPEAQVIMDKISQEARDLGKAFASGLAAQTLRFPVEARGEIIYSGIVMGMILGQIELSEEQKAFSREIQELAKKLAEQFGDLIEDKDDGN